MHRDLLLRAFTIAATANLRHVVAVLTLVVLAWLVVPSMLLAQDAGRSQGDSKGDTSVVDGLARHAADIAETVGVSIILGAVGVSLLVFIIQIVRHHAVQESYQQLRKNLGRGILLGLEFLVAGDIIGTVGVDPTFRNVGVLGLIVLIRTFLSFSLEVEIHGRWPWQKAQDKAG